MWAESAGMTSLLGQTSANDMSYRGARFKIYNPRQAELLFTVFALRSFDDVKFDDCYQQLPPLSGYARDRSARQRTGVDSHHED